VAQVVAYTLKIPLEKVTIKPSNSVVGANSQVTGGSLGSEAVSFVFLKLISSLFDKYYL
jgi:xanthine dehydrogenase/oxidase